MEGGDEENSKCAKCGAEFIASPPYRIYCAVCYKEIENIVCDNNQPEVVEENDSSDTNKYAVY